MRMEKLPRFIEKTPKQRKYCNIRKGIVKKVWPKEKSFKKKLPKRKIRIEKS